MANVPEVEGVSGAGTDGGNMGETGGGGAVAAQEPEEAGSVFCNTYEIT